MNTAISSRDERAFSAPALLVAGAFFMEFLDGTVIATALPDMARDFGVTAVELNIGISAYLITLAVLIASAPGLFLLSPWRSLPLPRSSAASPPRCISLSPCVSFRESAAR